MAGFRGWIVALLLTGLFAYVLILGGSELIVQNGGQSLESDSGLASYISSINKTLSENANSAKDVDDAFSNSTITTTTSIPYVDSIGGVWKTMRKYPAVIYDVTLGLVFSKLLSDTQKTLVVSTLMSIMIITVVLFAWKLIATGESER